VDTKELHSAIALLTTNSGRRSCLLLVHTEIDKLAEAAGEVTSSYGWPRVSVGKELAAVLLPEPLQYRPRAARRWVSDRLGGMSPGPVLCADIDLLFEPSLQLDPLALLRDVSRTTRLAVAWPGSYLGGVLAYAVPEHAHYYTWRHPQAGIVSLD
jgi:hypothetical protein